MTTAAETTNPAAATTPTLKNTGTTPKTPRKLFVNLPVGDLQRSIEFFEGLGFTFNAQFTDATATCMLVGADAYFMLLTREKFAAFARHPAGDPRREPTALFAVSVDSREEVDAMVEKAVASGGTQAGEPEDHGFMYEWSFHDLDGHGWGVFWMDPKTVQG
jgi:predicted lactoylglutathione lyase